METKYIFQNSQGLHYEAEAVRQSLVRGKRPLKLYYMYHNNYIKSVQPKEMIEINRYLHIISWGIVYPKSYFANDSKHAVICIEVSVLGEVNKLWNLFQNIY